MNFSISSSVRFLIVNVFPIISAVFVVLFGVKLLMDGGNQLTLFGLIGFLLSTLYVCSLWVENEEADIRINNAINEAKWAQHDALKSSAQAAQSEKAVKELSSEVLRLNQRLAMIEEADKGGF